MSQRPTLLAILVTGLTLNFSRSQDKSIIGLDAKTDVSASAKINVLARGPVHEACARPYEKNPSIPPAITKRPPANVVEQPPDLRPADANNMRWVPGYWDYDRSRDDFIWVSGLWRRIPDDRRWVMGYWADTADGFRRVRGHWAAAAEADFQIVPTPPASLDLGAGIQAAGIQADVAAGVNAGVTAGATTGQQEEKKEDKSKFELQLPGGNSQAPSDLMLPGSWKPTEQGYQWRPGYITEFREGQVWVPCTYDWTPMGWAFNSGFWDVAPLARGIMFAPLAIENLASLTQMLTLSPQHVLSMTSVMDNLFVNALGGKYMFGDLYAKNFADLGIQPWLKHSANAYDALHVFVGLSKASGLSLPTLQANLDARLAGRLTASGMSLTDQALLASKLAGPVLTIADQVRLALNANVLLAARAGLLVVPLKSAKFNGAALVALSAAERATIGNQAQAMLAESVKVGAAASLLKVTSKTVPAVGTHGLAGVHLAGYHTPGMVIGGVGAHGVGQAAVGQVGFVQGAVGQFTQGQAGLIQSAYGQTGLGQGAIGSYHPDGLMSTSGGLINTASRVGGVARIASGAGGVARVASSAGGVARFASSAGGVARFASSAGGIARVASSAGGIARVAGAAGGIARVAGVVGKIK